MFCLLKWITEWEVKEGKEINQQWEDDWDDDDVNDDFSLQLKRELEHNAVRKWRHLGILFNQECTKNFNHYELAVMNWIQRWGLKFDQFWVWPCEKELMRGKKKGTEFCIISICFLS